MMKTYGFHVNGMHCKSCIIVTESELGEVKGVTEAKTSLEKNHVEVTGDFGEKTDAEVMQNLTEVLAPHGYSLSVEAPERKVSWSDFTYALPIAAGFIALFILLQKLGIVNLVTSSNVGFGTAFLIGLIASVSTCMAVVGGLVLSLSASFAKEGSDTRPQMLFHVGRLISFVLLGGIVGALGSVFQFGTTGASVLGIVIALVLLVLGINLLDIFPWAKKLQPTMPGFIGKRVHALKNLNHTVTPFLVGIVTFFLPCGFTQSMQLYTLSTGSFWAGAMTMGAFALGTLPVLALLSFSSVGLQKKTWSGIFFKSAGLIVIFFGVFNLLNSLAGAGLISPVFNF